MGGRISWTERRRVTEGVLPVPFMCGLQVLSKAIRWNLGQHGITVADLYCNWHIWLTLIPHPTSDLFRIGNIECSFDVGLHRRTSRLGWLGTRDWLRPW